MKECDEKQLILEKEGLTFYYLYTPMCGTCQVARKMLTVIEELLPTINIHSVNLNFFPKEALELGIESVPCLLIIEDGIEKEKIYAFQSVGYLLDTIKKYLP